MRLVSLWGCLIALIVQAEEDMVPGLVGEYFDIGEELVDFPTLAKDRKPKLTRVDKAIHFDKAGEEFHGSGVSDFFYVRWNGVLRIPKDETYTFFLLSDDGSRLFIDGKEIIDNGGLHAMEEQSGDVTLKAGDHEIRVEFFDNTEVAGCLLYWESASQEKQIVPASAFLHRKPKNQTPNK